MKLKSLLAIVSCSAIALSIGVPSVADTVKDSQIKLEPTGIGNKDYRNKQNTSSMVGSWYSSVKDNEHRHTDPVTIYWDISSDGRSTLAWQREGQADDFANNTYKYTPTKKANLGALVSKDSRGRVYASVIKWISNDELILTLISDSNEPHRNGLQRRFVRINEPVATTLQQRAQQAAATSRDNASSRRTRELQNEIKTNTQRQQMVIPMFSGGLYK